MYELPEEIQQFLKMDSRSQELEILNNGKHTMGGNKKFQTSDHNIELFLQKLLREHNNDFSVSEKEKMIAEFHNKQLDRY